MIVGLKEDFELVILFDKSFEKVGLWVQGRRQWRNSQCSRRRVESNKQGFREDKK